MQHNFRSVCTISTLAAALAVSAASACAQTKTVKTVPVKSTLTLNGSELYRQYCAACHGADGKGAGPAADALKQHPSDLTQIAQRNDGKFPAVKVKQVILGQNRVTAHGSDEMPVWGDLFRSINPNNYAVELRVQNLLDYLQKMQR